MFFELTHFPGPGTVHLGALTGRAEIAVSGTGALDGIRLVDALLQPQAGATLGPGEAARMSVADRDRLMALLQMRFFGHRIAGDSNCRVCGEKFVFDFDVRDLVKSVAPLQPVETDADGWITTDDGVRFRLPSGEDELAASGLDPSRAANVIAFRCVPDGSNSDVVAAVEQKAQKVAPLIDLTLNATCPECGTGNDLAFAAERYFLSALCSERRRLLREIHRIAISYGWSYDSIVDLDRTHRRELVSQIERDRDNTRRARSVR